MYRDRGNRSEVNRMLICRDAEQWGDAVVRGVMDVKTVYSGGVGLQGWREGKG